MSAIEWGWHRAVTKQATNSYKEGWVRSHPCKPDIQVSEESERMPSEVLLELAAVIATSGSIIFHRSWRLEEGPWCQEESATLVCKIQEARSGKPQCSQPLFSTWGNYGTDPYDSYFQVHKKQDGSWKCQFGFTKYKSCLTNLSIFSDEATCSMVDRTAVDVIYLDFSEAFELCFNILADKLPRLD